MNPASWTSYDLSDFLLFSDRVYWRMFASYNEAMWPAHLVMVIAGVGVIAGLVRPGRWQSRLILVGLAVLWAWIAWAFFDQRYRTINWAAAYIVPAFAAQAMMLAIAALSPASPRLAAGDRPGGIVALGILAVALFVYPFLAWAVGLAWRSGEVFGLAPDPTAVATLAVIACWRHQLGWFLMVVPALWCAITALTLYTLGAPHFFAAPLLALCAVVAAGVTGRISRPAA